ncbi:IS66 family insertion sequence element accessory protein TnpA [Teredinibacter franksiae]|jgi:hypothetical protein|uniref:IS66 family insertion sequence element accessory protein TnpA n=1 Tax=Teredinibacter franksiae TaxID=2761453 RepID=UPI0016264E6B|nr:hypothetical protein [Teredinibacter franksiae]
MSKRRTYNWPQLFAEFERSGLSQVEFCKQHDLNPKYFNLKLSKLKAQEDSAFAHVVVQPELYSRQGLVLEVGNCKVHCPPAMSIPSFVSLIKSLA